VDKYFSSYFKSLLTKVAKVFIATDLRRKWQKDKEVIFWNVAILNFQIWQGSSDEVEVSILVA